MRSTFRWPALNTSSGLVQIFRCTNTNWQTAHVNPERAIDNRRLLSEPEPANDRPRRTAVVATLALFVGLAIVHTWPLATAPGTLSRNDNGDYILHEWIMAWVA